LIFSASSIYRKVSPYIETNLGAQQMLQYGLMMLNTPNIEFSMIGF
jgi:anionic cell wall polymer biosynthesis LytR-Cps2A-Psr (LCP) family protein